MMSIRLYLWLPQAVALASLHALPFVPHPDRLFGASVPREIRYGNEGRQALRRYELHLLPWTAAALLASLWLPLSWAVLWAEAAFLIPLIAAGWIFSRRRKEIRHLALPAPSTREARLTDADDRLFRQGLLFAIPLAILVGTALYLGLHWDAIPARFPVHWGAHGTPDRWSARSIAGVCGPLLLGALIVLFQLGIFLVTSWGSRRSARYPAGPIVLIVIACVVATGFSAAGLLPLHIVAARTLATFYIVSFSLLAVMIWLSLRRRTEAEEITPEACWHGDQFYYNPHDPALFVEKRIGLGLTFNFGNRLSWVVLTLTLLIPAGLLFLAFELAKKAD